MKRTYLLTIKVTADVGAFAGEYGQEGWTPDEVGRSIRGDLESINVVPDQLAHIYRQENLSVVCVGIED